MHRKFGASILFVIFFAFISGAFGQYDVRYEPTSYEIVDQMLELANVTGDDILYDLGCGDGRIVITAAKRFGTRGTGIDIDPVRIKESTENATKAGVIGSVRFIQQNLFETNISDATVVMLYLLPRVNIRLRPKLFHDLKPGTRIVSHEHYMGEWLPDQKLELESGARIHDVYFWILPANVSGTWEWTMSPGDEELQYKLNLNQKFQQVTGYLTSRGTTNQINNMTLEGNRIQFTLEDNTRSQYVNYIFDGLVDGNSIEGTLLLKTSANSRESRWSAKRDPSTSIQLDDRPLP